MTDDPHNDGPLLETLQRDQDSALNLIIERWEGPLFSYAWRYVQNATDARDLVAESFVRLHQNRHKLRPDTRLGAWLFTTLANLCHNQNRWRRRHPSVSFDAKDEETGMAIADRTAAEASLPAEDLERDEAVLALRKAIDALPHELKTTLLLHHYEHLSYREIGEVTGCSERGVETRLYRAKQRLRELMTGFVNDSTGIARVEQHPLPQQS